MMRLRVLVAAATVAAALVPAGVPAGVSVAAAAALIRVNQVGYSSVGAKRAFLLSAAPCAGVAFQVKEGAATSVSGVAGADAGAWNATYGHVCPLDFDGLSATGTYTVAAAGAVSPPFAVGTASALYAPMLANALVFFRAQRDGSDVDASTLQRRPAHRHDAHATVYRIPRYRGETLQGDLVKVGGPVDVEGGWFDAGDYVKFTGTTSFAVALMLATVREHPLLFDAGGGPAFRAEARRGVAWLLKMWNDRRRVLYYQVGIGSGNMRILGDHDVWRLPQEDDAMRQPARRYLAHRPVFREGPPGSPVPPSLAGRLAAAFGLCAQVWERTPLAARCLRAGQHVFDLARTAHVGAQVTASPVSYYPEDEWRDDLEWGATELYRGLTSPGAPAPVPAHASPRYYLKEAARWARAYVTGPFDGGDTLNLYDVSGIAHPELLDAMAAGGGSGLAVTRARLLTDLRRQLDPRTAEAAADPFGFGAFRWDPVPHAFGLVAEALAYDRVSGTQRYASLAARQLDWALGANAWGTTFVVGAGTTFPRCLQHQVANLAGSLDGTPPLLLGATVDGPAASVPGPGFFSNAAACPPGGGDPFLPFDRSHWRYVDRVSSWATVEPSLDYTAISFAATAMTAAG